MNTMKTMILMVVLTVLVVFAGSAIGGQNGAVLAFAMATIMNFGMYWFSDKIVLKMYGAKQITEQESPELFRIVRDLTMKANLPMPKVYIMDNPAPNAFATGRNPNHAAVAVTSGILNILDKDELSGVLGHELAHIKHRDILIGTIAATMAGAISMIANMAQWAMIFGGRSDRDEEGGSPIAGIVMIIVAPIAAMLIQMAISRSREYIADEGGARIHGNPLSLANALRKLHNASQQIPMDANPATSHMFIVSPLRGGGILSLFSTHPPIEERVKRLEAMITGIR